MIVRIERSETLNLRFILACRLNWVFRRKNGIDRIEKSPDDDSQQDNYYDRRSVRLRSCISCANTVVYGACEVLPCLTLTFETIDKTRPQEFSREVRHAPSTNDKPERRAVSKEEARCYDEIIRGQIDVVKRAVPFFSSHREYAEKSMPLSRTYARNRPRRSSRTRNSLENSD